MTHNWERDRISTGELADRTEDLLTKGYRIGLAAAHDDTATGGGLRIVYLFLAGRPDRRVELECVVPQS